MLNQVVIVGKVVNDPELSYSRDHKAVTTVKLSVKRSFKNKATNEYDSDYINCKLWSGIAKTTSMYCSKGSVIGVKGRIVMRYQDYKGNKKIAYPEVVAEKVTFIKTDKNSNKNHD